MLDNHVLDRDLADVRIYCGEWHFLHLLPYLLGNSKCQKILARAKPSSRSLNLYTADVSHNSWSDLKTSTSH